MHSKYQNIDTNRYKACIEEIGEAAKQRGDYAAHQACAAEWKQVVEYECSMESPWSKKN